MLTDWELAIGFKDSGSASMKCGQLITAIDNSVTSLRIRIGNGLRENVRISMIIWR
jgi:hypothetical protein